MGKVQEVLSHAWNVFTGKDSNRLVFGEGASHGNRPDRNKFHFSTERSIISSIYTRIGIDASGVELRHVRLDKEGRYSDSMDSPLDKCLTVQANIDQPARHFRRDVITTLCDEGVIAIVPVDTTVDPKVSASFEIDSMRVGKIVQWFPRFVKVRLYNDRTGLHDDVIVPKSETAIVENPLFPVMNEPNSTLQRLIRKLNLLDAVDEQSSSGRLDIIVQLPYAVKGDARRATAEQRRKEIEWQLKGSQYGIAYVDGTEKITQLNRPSENSLLKQVEYLTELLYSQLGLTVEVMNGTADEAAMLNYYNRTIDPLVEAVYESMHCAFLTKTARTQGQAVRAYRDPLKSVPVSQLAEIGDKMVRNEILSSNEMRQALGRKPSKDPKADELRNSNMPESELGKTDPKLPTPPGTENSNPNNKEGASQNGSNQPR